MTASNADSHEVYFMAIGATGTRVISSYHATRAEARRAGERKCRERAACGLNSTYVVRSPGHALRK